MLFLYRPRQTWMPYGLPRNRTHQAAYNRQLQQKFDSTRRVAPPVPAPAPAPLAIRCAICGSSPSSIGPVC